MKEEDQLERRDRWVDHGCAVMFRQKDLDASRIRGVRRAEAANKGFALADCDRANGERVMQRGLCRWPQEVKRTNSKLRKQH